MVPSEKIRLIVAGSGGMHYINIKRKISPLIVVFLVLLSVGCVLGEISQRKAKELDVQNLEEKYGGEFEVRSVESKNAGSGALKDHIYEMEVYSNDINDVFPVRIHRDGSRMVDEYEEHFYKEEINKEIESVEKAENGWVLNEAYAYHYNSPDLQPSKSLSEYKTNPKKIMVFVTALLTENSDITAESLYNYIEQLQEYGYHISLEVNYKGDIRNRVGINGEDAYITPDQIRDAFRELRIKNELYKY